MTMNDRDISWIGEQLSALLRATIKDLKSATFPLYHNDTGDPVISIPQQMIFDYLRHHARQFYYDVALKLDPVGNLNKDQTVFMKTLIAGIFPGDDETHVEFDALQKWFIEQRNLQYAVFEEIAKVVPMFARFGDIYAINKTKK